MTENNLFSGARIKNLSSFLEQNKNIDIVSADLSNTEVIAGFDWQKLAKQKEETLEILRVYQRLKKIMPELSPGAALALLKAGIHSALQIAALPKIMVIEIPDIKGSTKFRDYPADATFGLTDSDLDRTLVEIQFDTPEKRQANQDRSAADIIGAPDGPGGGAYDSDSQIAFMKKGRDNYERALTHEPGHRKQDNNGFNDKNTNRLLLEYHNILLNEN